jgi:hypothetical protein
MNIRRIMLLSALACIALLAFGALVASAAWGPQPQGALIVNRVYAYRGWQSTGIQLHKGDRYAISAQGEWLFSPFAGPNGPEGHYRYLAPDFYPLPRVRGGALIGRIGEKGPIFYVGRGTSGQADLNGLLYLRIDDDLLGDNEGKVTIDVAVQPPTPTPTK